MKPLWCFVRGFAVLGLLPLLAWAQKSPTEQEKIWLGIDCNIHAADRYYLSITASQPGEAMPLNLALDNYAGLSTPVNRRDRVQLYPGRIYSYYVGCNTWTTADIHFNPPPGYTVYVSYFGFPSSTPMRSFQANSTTMGPTYYLNIEVRPDDGVSYLPPGFALPPTVSPVTWAVSLGRLSGGNSAGTLRWRDTGISTDLLHALNLVYNNSYSDEVYEENFEDGGIKYIDAPQMQARVYRNSDPTTGYTLSFYKWYEDPGANRDFPGATPYATYAVANPDGSWLGRVRITRVQDGKTEIWTLGQNGGTLTLEQATSARKVTLESSQQALPSPHLPYPGDPAGTLYRRERVTVTDGAGANLASKVDRYYRGFVWSEELIGEIANPDSADGNAPLTTRYTYHDTGWPNGGANTKLKSIKRPDGTWVRYDYYEDAARWGHLSAVYEPWKDSSPADPASADATNSKVTTFSYAGERSFYQDIPAGSKTTIMAANATVAETTVGQSFWFSGNYGIWIYGAAPMRTETIQAYTSSGVALTTTRKVFHSTIIPKPDSSTPGSVANPDLAGKLWSQTNPDGTRVSAAHFRCDFLDHLGALTRTWDAAAATRDDIDGGFWCETYFTGASTQVAGSEAVTTWQGHDLDPVYLVPNRSTRRDVLRRIDGGLMIEIDYVYTGSGGYKLVYWKKTSLAEGLVYQTQDSNAALTSYSRIAGRVSQETRPDGTKVEHFFNDLMQVTRTEQKGVPATAGFPAQDAINTYLTYDAAGRVKATNTTAGGLSLTTSTEYDLAGQARYTVDERGLRTDFTYPDNRTVSAALPGGATKVVNKWADGSVKSVTGSAQVASYAEPTLNGDGTITRATYSGPGGASSPRWTKATTDWAGRTLKEERPAPPGASPAVFTKTYSYYSATQRSSGRVKKITEDGLAPTYHRYDDLGELEYTWLDVNRNANDVDPQPDLIGSDRVTRTRTQMLSDGGTWWRQTLNYAYNQDNDTSLLQSETRTRLVPYGGLVDDSNAGDFLAGKINELTRTYDVFRNETLRQAFVDRPSVLTTVTTNVSDSSVDDVVTTLNGRKVRSRTAQNLTSDSYYDSLGRLVKQTDPRTDTSSTARIGYHTTGTGAIGQVAWRQDTGGNQTGYAYDATGRLSVETDPLNKATRYAYNKRGQTIQTWGAATYPVETAFNDYGEANAQRTFAKATEDFTAAAWPRVDSGIDSTTGNPNPASWTASTSDKTLWTYHDATGTLTSKKDAAEKTVSYTYTPRGQLKSRTWARGVVTNYTYDPDTAELLVVGYPAGTTNIINEYNRQGLPKQITDATGLRYLDYCNCGKLTQETFATGFYGTRVLTYNLEASLTGALGRTKGVTLTVGGAAEQDYTYGFDTYGRFGSVGLAGTSITYAYGYTPNSNLLASITDAGSGWTQTRSYLSNRDLLDEIETKVSTATKAKFDYDHDTLGRRTNVVETGEMFARYQGAGQAVKWGYNDRSEVTSSQHYHGTNPADTSAPVGQRNLGFAYDQIGNRAATAGSTVDGRATGYVVNELNQIKARTTPGYATVSGLAPAAASVTFKVNGGTSQSTTRQGDYFHQAYPADNTNALWLSFVLNSTYGSSNGTGDVTGFSFLPKATTVATADQWTYDEDGNLTRDDRWAYTWDAENRLVTITTRADLVTAGIIPADKARQITLIYDYQGRRVQKTVKKGSGYTEAVSDTKFLYDGWNLLSEYSVSGSTLTLARGYVWGLDWSGSLQGAGGVGGLLMVRDFGQGLGYQPAFDGNGNLVALTKRADGSLAAAYEYGPFGETLRATGPYAASNPFRFSTKFTDDETGLVYYGLRYYSPSLGRFLNRDPISEQGGLNLYGFVGNNGVNRWDYLGMDPSDEEIMLAAINHGEFMRHMGQSHSFQTYDYNYNYVGAAFQAFADMGARQQAAAAASNSTGTGSGKQEVTSTIFDSSTGKVIDPRTTSLVEVADPNSGGTLTAYSLPTSGQSRFSGPGYMNAFGQTSPTFCLSCHDTTPQAQFNKQQSVLANALDWKVIAYEQLLGAGLTAGFGMIAEDLAAARSLVSVYRVEGAANARLLIDEAGRVTVTGDNMLFLNFGSQARAEEFLAARLSQGMSDAQIKSLQVPSSFLDDLRSAAVPESMARSFPNNPILVDVAKAPDQFGLRSPQISELQRYLMELGKK